LNWGVLSSSLLRTISDKSFALPALSALWSVLLMGIQVCIRIRIHMLTQSTNGGINGTESKKKGI
jgi:hypothetical protein